MTKNLTNTGKSENSKSYLITKNTSFLDVSRDVQQNSVLPGAYVVSYDDNARAAMLTSMDFTTDNLVDLTGSVTAEIIEEVNQFFLPESKQKFADFGFIYKKAIMLYGKPGTGKTCAVIKICENFTNTHPDGVILVNPNLHALRILFNTLPKTTPLLVLWEELDYQLDYRMNETNLLSFLDGEDQRANTFYLMTTNFINKISKRLLRPGRMSNLILVPELTPIARMAYLTFKLNKTRTMQYIKDLVSMTDGFTIDELKYLVLSTECLQYTAEKSVKDIIARREVGADEVAQVDQDEEELF